MAQQKSIGDEVIDDITLGVRKWFGKKETPKQETETKNEADPEAVKRANDSFRKRAESEKLAANRKLGAKPTPKKGKSSRKRAAKSY